MQPYFITASGTDLGKTLVMTALCWQLRGKGQQVTALKPVISGFSPKDMNSDTALILKSCGIEPTAMLMRSITPWHYEASLAPNMAAAREGRDINLQKLIGFCQDHAMLDSDIVLVEGVGGVMSPLTDKATVLDWMAALNWPCILVSGTYLGAISHTLTALETLKTRGIPVRAVVVSASEKSSVTLLDTAATVEKFIASDVPVVKLPRLAGGTELWKQAPPMHWICQHD